MRMQATNSQESVYLGVQGCPTYFDFISCDEAEREHNESRIDNWIKARMPLTAQ